MAVSSWPPCGLYLTVEVRERADDLADADEEEGGEGRRHHEDVQGRHQIVLDVQT